MNEKLAIEKLFGDDYEKLIREGKISITVNGELPSEETIEKIKKIIEACK